MNIGKIVQVIGNVVDIEFAEGKLPEILSAIMQLLQVPLE